MTTEQTAEALRQMHPHRFRFRVFSDKNPLMLPIKAMALEAGASRKPVSGDNPFLVLEQPRRSGSQSVFNRWARFATR